MPNFPCYCLYIVAKFEFKMKFLMSPRTNLYSLKRDNNILINHQLSTQENNLKNYINI